mmetsp:Transcript_36621/g.68246  ORF Transcript_36621/g.68246 Transcript_36621/m.68246 type:complete len:224 (-) Transcript_36621:733-1404(-)
MCPLTGVCEMDTMSGSREGSTNRNACPAKKPRMPERISSRETLSSTPGPKAPPSMLDLAKFVQRAKRMRTTTSPSTVMPRMTLQILMLLHCSSAMTAIADAGLLAVIRAAVRSAMLNLATKVGWLVITCTATRPELATKRKPPLQSRSVNTVISATWSNIGPSKLYKSGINISAPAAPAMNASDNLLIRFPSKKMLYRDTRFVTYGPTITPIIRKPVICGRKP